MPRKSGAQIGLETGMENAEHRMFPQRARSPRSSGGRDAARPYVGGGSPRDPRDARGRIPRLPLSRRPRDRRSFQAPVSRPAGNGRRSLSSVVAIRSREQPEEGRRAAAPTAASALGSRGLAQRPALVMVRQIVEMIHDVPDRDQPVDGEPLAGGSPERSGASGARAFGGIGRVSASPQ